MTNEAVYRTAPATPGLLNMHCARPISFHKFWNFETAFCWYRHSICHYDLPSSSNFNGISPAYCCFTFSYPNAMLLLLMLGEEVHLLGSERTGFTDETPTAMVVFRVTVQCGNILTCVRAMLTNMCLLRILVFWEFVFPFLFLFLSFFLFSEQIFATLISSDSIFIVLGEQADNLNAGRWLWCLKVGKGTL